MVTATVVVVSLPESIEEIIKKYRKEEERVKEAEPSESLLSKMKRIGKYFLHRESEKGKENKIKRDRPPLKDRVKKIGNSLKTAGKKVYQGFKAIKKLKDVPFNFTLGEASNEPKEKVFEAYINLPYLISFLSTASYFLVDGIKREKEYDKNVARAIQEVYSGITNVYDISIENLFEDYKTGRDNNVIIIIREKEAKKIKENIKILIKYLLKNRKIEKDDVGKLTEFLFTSILFSKPRRRHFSLDLVVPLYLGPEEYIKHLLRLKDFSKRMKDVEKYRRILTAAGKIESWETFKMYLELVGGIATLGISALYAGINAKIPALALFGGNQLAYLLARWTIMPDSEEEAFKAIAKEILTGNLERYYLSSRGIKGEIKQYTAFVKEGLKRMGERSIGVEVIDADTAGIGKVEGRVKVGILPKKKERKEKYRIFLPYWMVLDGREYLEYILEHEVGHKKLKEGKSRVSKNIRKYWEGLWGRERQLQNIIEDFVIDTTIFNRDKNLGRQHVHFFSKVIRQLLSLYTFQQVYRTPAESLESKLKRENVIPKSLVELLAFPVALIDIFGEDYGKMLKEMLKSWEFEIIERVRKNRGYRISYRGFVELLKDFRKEVYLNYGISPGKMKKYREKLDEILEAYFGPDWYYKLWFILPRDVLEKPDFGERDIPVPLSEEELSTAEYEEIRHIASMILEKQNRKENKPIGNELDVREYVKMVAGVGSSYLFKRVENRRVVLQNIVILTDLSKSVGYLKDAVEEATAMLYYGFLKAGIRPKQIVYIMDDETIMPSQTPLRFRRYSNLPGSPQGKALEIAERYAKPEIGTVYVMLSDGKPTDLGILEKIKEIQEKGGYIVYIQLGDEKTEFSEYLEKQGFVVEAAGTTPYSVIASTQDAFRKLYERL